MSETANPGEVPANAFQVPQAMFPAPGTEATCKVCGQSLRDTYYEVNGQPFCPDCREHIHSALTGGSPFGRFARATLFGSLAGALGAAIYYGVREATQSEFGLISILVGFMVGLAVKRGCNARGGWFYQLLAVFLTYTAIVSTYVPIIINGLRQHKNLKADAGNVQRPANADAGKDQKPANADADAAGAPGGQARPSIGMVLVALVLLIGLFYAAPIIVGFSSPVMLIIIAVGLYEAWVINRRPPLSISGPFQHNRPAPVNPFQVQPGT
jgi:hypothetical protein